MRSAFRSDDRRSGVRGRAGAAAAIAAMLALAACTSSPSSDAGETAPAAPVEEVASSPVLVATTEGGDVALDGSSGALLAGGPGTVATSDASTMYRARVLGGRTVVTTLDPRTGVTMGSSSLRGELELAVASVSGEALALVQPAPGAPSGSLLGLPMPRSWTPIVVADPGGGTSPARFRLEGNYEPEAFSIDDERLFLIEYLPAEAPAVYRVTVLDLETGEVRPVTGRFKSPPERMPGVRLGQVYDPATSQMYTLYSNQPGAYAAAYEHAGGSSREWPQETFVHVLNLRKGWAYCAGVPKAMWGGTAREQALVPSADGRMLYIVDSGEDMVAVMDTRSLEVVRTASVELDATGDAETDSETGRTSLAVTTDGATLFIASGSSPGTVSAIDTEALTLADRWASPLPASGLGLSLDGSALYIAGGGRIALVDTATGEARATVPTAVLEPIVGVHPLAGAADASP